MSSVQRFLKQVPQGLSYVAPGGLDVLAGNAYVLVPTSGNVVANYPSAGGAMVRARADDAATKPVFDAIANAITVPAPYGIANGQAAAAGGVAPVVVLRDMGKTVFGPTADTAALAAAGTNQSSFGYFRQVQLLVPGNATQSQVGGATSSAFGVLGGTNNYSSYLTFYLPVPVAGVLLQDAGLVLSAPAVGGQM